jgi:hypothetical protein
MCVAALWRVCHMAVICLTNLIAAFGGCVQYGLGSRAAVALFRLIHTIFGKKLSTFPTWIFNSLLLI